MANEEHLRILKQGMGVWNQWREKNPGVRPDFEKADLRGVDLREADLRGVDLREAYLREVNLSGADLGGADLIKADLIKADLIKAYLSRTYLNGADLSGVDLTGAYLRGADLSGADLSRAHLREVYLGWVNLSGAHLHEANLSKADFSWADLSVADLGGADLSGANLSQANLGGADLNRANLSGANLSGANLSEANLSGADFNRVTVASTLLGDLDLSAVKGLQTVRHRGPSILGIDTVYRSGGKIPEAFLRGCGVPDNFIAYMGSLTGKAFEYYSCFISYSTQDDAFAQRLHNDLQGEGVRCWFAPEHIKAGEKLSAQIDQAIRLHDKLLLILSEHSMHSEWVMTEIRRARQAELREKRRKLFPIRLVEWDMIRDWNCFDADTGKDLAVEVREYFVPDFSCWKDHDAYQQAFTRLLRDLKASEA